MWSDLRNIFREEFIALEGIIQEKILKENSKAHFNNVTVNIQICVTTTMVPKIQLNIAPAGGKRNLKLSEYHIWSTFG